MNSVSTSFKILLNIPFYIDIKYVMLNHRDAAFKYEIMHDRYSMNASFRPPVSLSDRLVSVTPSDVAAAEVSAPGGVMVVPEEPALLLKEGIAKGGYPVDIAAQSTVDLTSIGQSELGCTSTLIEPGLEPAAVAQLEIGYTVLDTQESYNEEQDFPPSITEVIQPMEMAELVDILPTLSLIEEETPSSPSTSSVMDMLESFGLGINENNTLFHLENSNLTNEAGCLSQPDVNCNSSSSSVKELQGQDTSVCHDAVNATGGDVPVLDTEALQVHSREACFPVRNQVEWDRPSSS